MAADVATTVATNLAVIRSQAGRDVLLVDADDQETSSDFTALRNERQEGGAGYTVIKLTGPAVRGDWETVERHRTALAGMAGHRNELAAYDAMVGLARRLSLDPAVALPDDGNRPEDPVLAGAVTGDGTAPLDGEQVA